MRDLLYASQKKGIHEYDDSDFQIIKDAISASKDFLGRLLINGTHPSGVYDRTDLPTVTFSKDTQDVNVRITIHWRGKAKSLYETTYSFALNRSKSAYSLQVLRDTAAVFKIDPTNLRETESALKDVFRRGP